MLTCKNVVVINAENDKTGEKALIVPYDRVYLEYSAEDATEKLTKTNKGSAVKLNGAEWEGTKPKSDVTEHFDTKMVSDAMTYLTEKWGKSADFAKIPEENRPYVILLTAASYASDLWLRATIQAENKPKAAEDPAVALEKLAKSLVAAAAAKGKVLSIEKARVKAAVMLEDDEEAAA